MVGRRGLLKIYSLVFLGLRETRILGKDRSQESRGRGPGELGSRGGSVNLDLGFVLGLAGGGHVGSERKRSRVSRGGSLIENLNIFGRRVRFPMMAFCLGRGSYNIAGSSCPQPRLKYLYSH